MRTFIYIVAILAPFFGLSQPGKLLEIIDLRPGKDSVFENRSISNDIKLTSKYICRQFDFCLGREKAWLTEIQKNETIIRLARADKSYLIIQRDSIKRIQLEVHLSCMRCSQESYGYSYEYLDTGNTVVLTELTNQELFDMRRGVKPELTQLQDREKTFIKYGSDDSIKEIINSRRQELLFSLKLTN